VSSDYRELLEDNGGRLYNYTTLAFQLIENIITANFTFNSDFEGYGERLDKNTIFCYLTSCRS